MATSPETFKQVRDILKKLDRSIDSARDRRLSNEHDADEATDTATPPDGAPRPLRAKPMRTPSPDDAWRNAHS